MKTIFTRWLLTVWCNRCAGTVGHRGTSTWWNHCDLFGRDRDRYVDHRARGIESGYRWERWQVRVLYLLLRQRI